MSHPFFDPVLLKEESGVLHACLLVYRLHFEKVWSRLRLFLILRKFPVVPLFLTIYAWLPVVPPGSREYPRKTCIVCMVKSNWQHSSHMWLRWNYNQASAYCRNGTPDTEIMIDLISLRLRAFFISRLLLIKVKLEETWLGGDQALVTCKRLLQTWKTLYDMEVERSVLRYQYMNTREFAKTCTILIVRMDHSPINQNFDLNKFTQNSIIAWKSITKLVIFQSFVAKCCKMRII
jgi:hypothetical protein